MAGEQAEMTREPATPARSTRERLLFRRPTAQPAWAAGARNTEMSGKEGLPQAVCAWGASGQAGQPLVGVGGEGWPPCPLHPDPPQIPADMGTLRCSVFGDSVRVDSQEGMPGEQGASNKFKSTATAGSTFVPLPGAEHHRLTLNHRALTGANDFY